MIAAMSRIVVSEGPCELCSVHAPHVHHRDFPENIAQGETIEEAAHNLHHLFVRNLDSVAGECHCRKIRAAMADIEAFLKALESGEVTFTEHHAHEPAASNDRP